MSDSLEHLLDFTLDVRERRRRQHEAELGLRERAIRDSHAELERRRTKFSTEVRCLIQKAAGQANHHLATRPERCEFREMSEYSIGPWYPGGPICNPIAYQLRARGHEVGETLIVELTHDGMIEALLWPFRQFDHRGHVTRTNLGWQPAPLYSFDGKKAGELLVLYLTAITQRWPLDRENADRQPRTLLLTGGNLGLRSMT
jgi:hypothetical protein